jgi:cell division protein FtsW
MLYSTSSYAGSNKFGDAAYFVKKQLFATGLGLVGMYIVAKIPYRFWMKVSSMAYLAAIVLCTAVIFIGTEANGQARWLKIGPLSFQPSEFAKFGHYFPCYGYLQDTTENGRVHEPCEDNGNCAPNCCGGSLQ